MGLEDNNEEDWIDVEADLPKRKKRIKKFKCNIKQKKKLARRHKKHGVKKTNIDEE